MINSTTAYNALRSFFAFAHRYKWGLLVVGLIFTISNITLALVPVFVGQLIDTLAHQATPWLWVWLLIGASIIHDLSWQLANVAFRHYVLPISFAYENLLFKKTIDRPFDYFTDKFTGKLSSYVTSISQEFRDLLSNTFFNYISQIISIVSVVLILGSINIETAIVFMFFLVVMLILGRATVGKLTSSERKHTDIAATKSGHIVDAISNFAAVKAFHKEQRELMEVKKQQDQTLRAASSAFNWGLVFWWSQSFVIRWLIWPVIILINVAFYLDGTVSIGQLATILSTALIFTSTIWEMIWSISQINLRFARTEEAYGYLFGNEIIYEEADPRSRAQTVEFSETLKLVDLSFAYPDRPSDMVLDNVNLTIKKGEKVGVVGKSGSGKSTLTKLLIGYYDHTAGSLLVDGNPVNIRDFARLIAYVPQDTSLFHRSIADNIGYTSDKDLDRETVVHAAKQAQADEFIQRLKDGYDALVGERGVKLSGGQRQRIAIARAILKDAPILVLDEATSALDSESELLVQKALENLWRDKTAIVIAHRLSTIAKLDRIIVLDNGSVIEEGTHQQLIEKGGAYAKLWSHQSGGFIEE